MLNTIEDNKNKYSDRQYRRAVRARELYTKIGCPSIQDFKLLVKNCLINNCPVTIEDIKICEDIFGRDYSSPACKTPSSANIRSKDGSSKINIYYGQDRQAVRAVAREINEFLLSSNAPSFHKRF